MSASKRLIFVFFMTLITSLAADEDLPVAPRQSIERLEISRQAENILQQETTFTPQNPQPLQDPGQPKEEGKSNITVNVIPLLAGAWKIVFLFPETVAFTEENEQNSLYLKFNQSLANIDLSEVEEKLTFLLHRLANGYYTLYLEAQRPVLFLTYAEKKVFCIEIQPAYGAAMLADRTLELARARILFEKRCYGAAYEALLSYLKAYPEDKEGWMLLASLEIEIPRWVRSTNILQRLHTTFPLDENIGQLLCEGFFPHSSFAQFKRQLQRTIGQAAIQVYQISGEWLFCHNPWNSFYAGTLFEVDRGHIRSLTDKEGENVGFLGTRFQVGLYSRWVRENGSETTSWLWLSEGTFMGVGGELAWLMPVIQGKMFVRANWHKPYWEVFETLAFFGREDDLRLGADSVFSRHIEWNFTGGMHRIGIKHASNAIFSFLAYGDIFAKLSVLNPIVALNYGFEAEYVTHTALRTNVSGTEFAPVPLTSYEYHNLRVFLYYDFREYWHFIVFGGETFNRLGTNDWTAGVTLRYAEPCCHNWEVELSAIRLPNVAAQGAPSDYLTAIVKYHF